MAAGKCTYKACYCARTGGFGTWKTPVPEDFLVLSYLENGVNISL